MSISREAFEEFLALGDSMWARLRNEASQITAIDRVEAENLSYDDFFRSYLIPNKPVVIRGLEGFFPCISQWTLEGAEGLRRPNLHRLAERYGSSMVPVAQCNKQQYNDQQRSTMKFSDYISYWKEVEQTRGSVDGGSFDPNNPLLYLKDWHLVNEFGSAGVYEVPEYFEEDWIDSHWKVALGGQDDYRFVYMGPKGSWTPLHADVFRSYSWSFNVCGRKRWLFFPPNCESYLKDSVGNTPFNVRGEVDDKRYPSFHRVKPIEVFQNQGEAIFVPSRWWHQVHNEEDTISVNHNWANACNVDFLWELLRDDYASVVREIEDLQDTFDSPEEFLAHCQFVVRANSGLNFADFLTYLQGIHRSKVAGGHNLYLDTVASIQIRRTLLQMRTYFEDLSDKDHLAKLNVVLESVENSLKTLGLLEN